MKHVATAAVFAAAWAVSLGTPLGQRAEAQDTVTLAFLAPLSGGTSAIGIGGRNSAQLAVKLKNEDPDTKYTYRLEALDTECKPNVGVQAATRVGANPDVIAAVAHYCSAVAISTVDVYHRFGLPMSVWGAVLPDITYDNSYPEVHRVNGTMINQNDVASKFMTEKGYEDWVIIHDTTDYGQGHREYFAKNLKEDGGNVLATFGVSPDQQDFTTELTKAKSLNPDVIYFGGLTPVGVRLRTQMERIGIDAQFQGTSGIKSDAYIDGVGAELAEGTVAFMEGAPIEKLPGGARFRKAYDEAGYDDPPEAYGPFAFAAMTMMIDTIERVGPDRAKVTQALNKIEGRQSIVGEITFDDHGQNVVAPITKYVVQDGKWVVWEDSAYASGDRQLAGR